jgi:hypothetical protein
MGASDPERDRVIVFLQQVEIAVATGLSRTLLGDVLTQDQAPSLETQNFFRLTTLELPLAATLAAEVIAAGVRMVVIDYLAVSHRELQR